MENISNAVGILATILAGAVAGGKILFDYILPVRRILDIEELCKDEDRKKRANQHTFLRWGLEYQRVLLRNSLIERGLAYGKTTDPGGVFGSQDNFSVPYVRFKTAGDRWNRLARYIPFRKWLLERHIKARFSEYIEADRRVVEAIQKYSHLKEVDPSEYARRVAIDNHTEFWETFMFSKGVTGPVGLCLSGRGYLFYPSRKVVEVSLEEMQRKVAQEGAKRDD